MTWPRPPQVGQLTVREPGSAPLPSHLAAGIELADFDLLLHPEGRFFERDLHVVTQIGAALAPFAIGGRAAAEKRFENSAAAAAATEDFAENIERIMETAAASRAALSESGMPEAIVGRALVGIDQDVVGFAEFLEFLLGVRVVRILVRMKFDRELAISALHLFLGGVSRDRQDFVVIALVCVAIGILGRIGRM